MPKLKFFPQEAPDLTHYDGIIAEMQEALGSSLRQLIGQPNGDHVEGAIVEAAVAYLQEHFPGEVDRTVVTARASTETDEYIVEIKNVPSE